MPVFGTLSQLDTYVKKVTIERTIVPLVEVISKEKLNNRVESEIYKKSAGSNDFYSNTFGLRNAATSTKTKYGNGTHVETHVQPKGKYTSYYGKEDITDMIVEWLNNDHKNGFYKGYEISGKGRGFIEKAQKDLTVGGELKKRISNALKTRGYVISRSSNI